MQHFCDEKSREPKRLFAGVKARTFWADRMLIALVELDAHAVVPAHSHPHEQAGTVLSGEFEMTIAGKTKVMKPGDTYLIPGNVTHAVTVGGKATKVLDVFSPVREEYK